MLTISATSVLTRPTFQPSAGWTPNAGKLSNGAFAHQFAQRAVLIDEITAEALADEREKHNGLLRTDASVPAQ